MKLSELRKLNQNLPLSKRLTDPSYFHRQLKAFGIDTDNFYQELEMDSRYVDTHQDISYPDTNFQFHSHAFYEVLCCRNNCGAEYLVGSERYKLQSGDIIFVPPGISHRPLLSEHMTEPYIRDVMWISEEFMRTIGHLFPDPEDGESARPSLFRTSGTRWEYICDLFHNGVLEAETQDINWEAAVLANTLTVLTHLNRARYDLRAKPLRAEAPELLDQVLAYVEQHLSEKLSLRDIAHHFFVSESTITQTFRRKMGVSYYRCVTQRRLISAKALIEHGLPMESVASEVGFSDYSSFFRAFKQEFGISPRQYRKLHNPSDQHEKTPL